MQYKLLYNAADYAIQLLYNTADYAIQVIILCS